MKKITFCLVVAVLASVVLCGCPAITGSSVPVSVGDNVTLYQGTGVYCSGQVKEIKGPWVKIQDVVDNVIQTAWINTDNIVRIKMAIEASKIQEKVPGN